MLSDSQLRDELQSLRIGSLVSWITLADVCLENPVGAMARAAEDYDRQDALSRLVNRLEKAVGRKLMTLSMSSDPHRLGKRRGGHLTEDGLFLTELSVAIEHLLLFYQNTENPHQAMMEFSPVKKAIFALLKVTPQRASEKEEFSSSV
jgi:hypothetical protein